jgi:hypothetical protein
MRTVQRREKKEERKEKKKVEIEIIEQAVKQRRITVVEESTKTKKNSNRMYAFES